MIFKPGKFYKHNAGDIIHICGYANSYYYGEGLIAENKKAEYFIVGSEEENAINYKEVSKIEWEEK